MVFRRTGWKARLASVGMILTSTVAAPLHAQEDMTAPASVDTAPACMEGALRDVVQVRESGRGRKYPIIVATRDVALLESAGFERIECSGSDLASPAKRTAFRDGVCELAAYGNEAVQEQITRSIGVDASILCGSAELAMGAWSPKRLPQHEQQD